MDSGEKLGTDLSAGRERLHAAAHSHHCKPTVKMYSIDASPNLRRSRSSSTRPIAHRRSPCQRRGVNSQRSRRCHHQHCQVYLRCRSESKQFRRRVRTEQQQRLSNQLHEQTDSCFVTQRNVRQRVITVTRSSGSAQPGAGQCKSLNERTNERMSEQPDN
jgi:hypothetical protein